MKDGLRFVDSDTHVREPPDLLMEAIGDDDTVGTAKEGHHP
jgi:hypothetical protein